MTADNESQGKPTQPSVISSVEVERFYTGFETAQLGQWYWRNYSDEPVLMCVREIGSNYVELSEPELKGSRFSRVHRDEFDVKLTHEPEADAYIKSMVELYQHALADNMAEIQRLTEELGIAPQLNHQTTGDSQGKSLALLSGQVDVDAFKNALVLAQKETLPALFKRNEELSGELARWMGATGLPLQAKLGPMKASVSKIEDRLFNIQLYTGIFETVVTITDGQPAARDEKLRVMQRRLYMDEECLLDYETGGMTFKSMDAFDRWLAKPNNVNRILPFPRCMVSMKVRRHTKDRSEDNISAFVAFSMAEADKQTYLMVRNGEQLYRVSTEIDFGEQIFPERAVFDPSEPMMMKLWGSDRIETMITKRDFDDRVAKSDINQAKSKQWALDNPQEQWEIANPNQSWWYANPYKDSHFSIQSWHPCDDSSVYYDLAMAKIQTEIKEYNRVALVVQGLFDRTHTLIPHAPVKMWSPDSFSKSVELIYDSSMALHWGDAPDINAYVQKCNAQVTEDSVMFGQEEMWEVREADRENVKMDNNYKIPYERKHYYKRLRPYGDPGPGRIAYMASLTPRSKVATFTWLREKSYSYDRMVKAQIKVPISSLFNVSAYQLGDYIRFFTDPRTRSEYLSWAPMLLSAEEYHRGTLEAEKPLAS
ncbi:MAG: hypothetical protein V7693_16130 [Halopseudomonas sabulinigri]